ncbi:MAG: FkbM family methyltransferase [Acetobacteraceae bacterium]|nr:FkbM family methyltransferase [Acetobacteraceae bacterium]
MTFRSLLKPPDQARYLLWHATGRRRPFTFILKSGLHIGIRKPDDKANDFGVFYEVFVERCYAVPASLATRIPGSVRSILDLGSNCGVSLLWWHLHYPDADILGFEAHPANAAAAQANIDRNRAGLRITLRAEAVGATHGRVRLSDRGAGASMFYRNAPNYLEVPMVDLFAAIAGRRFDLLKIDIEGAEFALLDDPRFDDLAPPALVMEWHEVGRPGAQAYVHERLSALGYDVQDVMTVPNDHGVLWAVRS